MYWVLFVVLLDLLYLNQDFSASFGMLLVMAKGGGGLGLCVSPMGGFLLGGGSYVGGGNGTLWGCDPPVGVSWQLCRT